MNLILRPWLILAGICLSMLGRLVQLGLAWQHPGLFSYIGYDFTNLWLQAWVLVRRGTPSAYELDTVQALGTPLIDGWRQQMGQLDGNPPLEIVPGPYPPPFIAALVPTTVLPPQWAFAVWIVVNLACLSGISWMLAQRFTGWRLIALLAPIAFYPLSEALILGQPTVLLMCALTLGYVAFEAGQEFRAGLWLGLLLIKPQFAVGIGLVLLLKQRWRAVGGMVLIGALIAISSIASLGRQGLTAYTAVLSMFSGFHAAYPGVLPEVGITWHAVLLNVLPPTASEQEGTLLTILLSVATLAVLPVIWRGEWNPCGSLFATRVLATLIVTMLVAFHNHLHGATMLVPAALLTFAQADTRRVMKVLLLAGLFTHPVMFVVTRALNIHLLLSLVYIALMCVLLGVIVVSELVHARRSPGPLPPRTAEQWSLPAQP